MVLGQVWLGDGATQSHHFQNWAFMSSKSMTVNHEYNNNKHNNNINQTFRPPPPSFKPPPLLYGICRSRCFVVMPLSFKYSFECVCVILKLNQKLFNTIHNLFIYLHTMREASSPSTFSYSRGDQCLFCFFFYWS